MHFLCWDKRPDAGFVKAYEHNRYFTSLKIRAEAGTRVCRTRRGATARFMQTLTVGVHACQSAVLRATPRPIFPPDRNRFGSPIAERPRKMRLGKCCDQHLGYGKDASVSGYTRPLPKLSWSHGGILPRGAGPPCMQILCRNRRQTRVHHRTVATVAESSGRSPSRGAVC
jgi:hypothetical protein